MGSAVGFLGQSLCSKGAVQRLPYTSPTPDRKSVLRTGGEKHIRESRRRFWILDFWVVSFSEHGSTRGVLIDGTAALHSGSREYQVSFCQNVVRASNR